MPKVTNKISVYGDSAAISQDGSQTRAQRIYNFNTAKFGGSGYNEWAYGGQAISDTLLGKRTSSGANIFGGLDFQNHIATVDDCDIVIFSLGGNDGAQAQNAFGPPRTQVQNRTDYLTVAANALIATQYAQAAGKRVVWLGCPHFNLARALSIGGTLSVATFDAIPAPNHFSYRKDVAVSKMIAIREANSAIRLMCAFYGVTHIPVAGPGGPGGEPDVSTPDVPFAEIDADPTMGGVFTTEDGTLVSGVTSSNGYTKTLDGIHPVQAYSHAISDFVAGRIITIFGL